MSIPATLRRMGERLPSALAVLKIVVPMGLGLLLASAIIDPYHRIVEILVGFFITAAAILVRPARAISAFIVIFLFPAQLSIGTSNTVFILILLSAWIAQQVISGKRVSVRTPLDLPILVMTAAYLLSLSNVSHGMYGVNFKGLGIYLTCVAIYYLVVNLTPDEAAIRRLLWAGVAGATLIGAIGVFEIFNPGRELLPYFLVMRELPPDMPIVRAGSAFRNSSVLSQYAVLYLLFTVFMFAREKSRYLRVLLLTLFAAYLLIFASTAMRGALLAASGGLVFLLWRGGTTFDRRKVFLTIVVCATVFLVAHSLLSSAGVVPNMWSRFSELSQRIGSHVSRKAVMTEVFYKSLEHPLIGHGPVIAIPRGFVALGSNNPHCQYLLYFYTIGLLGLGAFIWLMVDLFRVTAQALRAGSKNKFLIDLALLFQTVLVIFFLHEMVDDYSSSSNYPLFIWYLFGLIVATRNVMLNEVRALNESVATVKKESGAPG